MNMSAGFDKEKFEQSEATVFRFFKKALENGTLYVIAPKTNTPFFYVEWARSFLVFKIKPEEFTYKKKLFRKGITLDWDRLRHIAKKTLDMNNREIQQSDVEVTTISVYDIFGSYVDKDFTDSMRLSFEESNLEKVFVKKFELDQASSFVQLRELLQEADLDDPLYNEIKLEAQRAKKIYEKKESAFEQELSDFRSRMRSNKQLSVLSQLTS